MLTEAEKKKMSEEHFEKYDRLANALGVQALSDIVVSYIAPRSLILETLAIDAYLNPIRLRKWDACDANVRTLVRKAGGSKALGQTGGWSLGDSVCVLKHVARHYVARKYHVGDVAIHVGMPTRGNPYAGMSLIGPDRHAALAAYKTGDHGRYTFWYAPSSGGARELTGPEEIDWESSGV